MIHEDHPLSGPPGILIGVFEENTLSVKRYSERMLNRSEEANNEILKSPVHLWKIRPGVVYFLFPLPCLLTPFSLENNETFRLCLISRARPPLPSPKQLIIVPLCSILDKDNFKRLSEFLIYDTKKF